MQHDRPPTWNPVQLEADRIRAIENFRRERIEEPLEAYLEAFDRYQGSVEELLEATVDLRELNERAIDILTNRSLLEAFRYLSGPPISEDDLKTLAEAALAPSRLREDAAMVNRIIEVVKMQLDRRRFPWISDEREPTEAERNAAVLASAAVLATRWLQTTRRSTDKQIQEMRVEAAFERAGLVHVRTRKIVTLGQAPAMGEFCRESLLGNRKADFVLRLWDDRLLAVECKVSNSSTNSVKRLNNDAAAKAEAWITDFGARQVVPAALLSGVYKLHNLEDAQNRGLALFWAHDLGNLLEWIEGTRNAG
jgi:hypothetical protein